MQPPEYGEDGEITVPSPNFVESGDTAAHVIGSKVCRTGTARGDRLLGKSYVFAIAMQVPVMEAALFGFLRLLKKDAAGGALYITPAPTHLTLAPHAVIVYSTHALLLR